MDVGVVGVATTTAGEASDGEGRGVVLPVIAEHGVAKEGLRADEGRGGGLGGRDESVPEGEVVEGLAGDQEIGCTQEVAKGENLGRRDDSVEPRRVREGDS